MAALLTSTLKTAILLEKSTPEQLRVDDNKVNWFSIGDDRKIARKLGKLFMF